MTASETSHTASSGSQKGSGGSESRPPLSPAYLILGDDEPKVELALRRLRERIVSESGTDLNIDEFHAERHAAGEVVAAANTLAFLGGVRLVLVHGVESWRKPDKEEIVRYLEAPAPDACLALVGVTLPAKDVLRKAFGDSGDLLEFRSPKPWELPDWTVKQARKAGLKLGMGEAKLIVERVGEHQQVIVREVEKLSAYKGKARVTREDVESLVPLTLEARVFDLVDAVVDGQPARAFEIVEELYGSGEKPMSLFFRLLRHYQQLGRVVALREAGYSAEQIKTELKLKPYPAKKLLAQARDYHPGRIRLALSRLTETDARLKGMSGGPPELELELCIGGLIALR